MEMFRALIGPDNGAFGIACIRIGGRRMFSHVSPLDIVVALVVGSNISRAMTGKAPFLATLAATLLLCVLHRLLAWACYRYEPL